MENNLKKSLSDKGFQLKKKFGQNFLSDSDLLNEIVLKAGVDENTTVLEIGCGAGALTKVLAKKAKKVIGYEIDEKLKPILKENLEGIENVEIVFGDIMKERVSNVEKKIGGEYIMVANLPYYITTPIVTEFLEKSVNLKSMSIMVQEEVANRFSAKNGTAEYGAITVAIKLRGEAKIIERVGREKFTPIPNVDSAVVRIDIDKEKNKDVDLLKVRDAVRCGFSSRRKMLVNNLMNTFKINRERAERILKNSNIALTARGEILTAEEYIKLSTEIEKEIKNG